MDSVSKRNVCPACGYILDFEPWADGSPSDEICPCCGIQFGYTDAAGGDMQRRTALYEKWRSDWIAAGMPWRSPGPAPVDWNPTKQIKSLGGGR